MSKCAICGREQKQVGSFKMSIVDKDGEETESHNIPAYNIDLFTFIKGKHICNDCMNTYNKIYALQHDIDFSCMGNDYYADGRNLE